MPPRSTCRDCGQVYVGWGTIEKCECCGGEVTVQQPQEQQQYTQSESESEIQDTEFEQTEYITQAQLKELATILTNLGVTNRSEKLNTVNA